MQLAGSPGGAHPRSDTRRGKLHLRRAIACLTGLPGVATNDEAEYVAPISALVDLRGRIELAGKSLYGYTVVAPTDSQLLVGQLTRGWQDQAANLRSLVNEAAALIQTFGQCDPSAALGTGLVRVPRTISVRVLGHLTEQAESQLDRCQLLTAL